MNMETIFGAFLILAAVAFGLWFLILKVVHLVRKELNDITVQVNSHLEQTARLAQQSGSGTVQAMKDVYSRLGTLEETSNKILEIGRDIGKLQDVLRAPKARGGFGEFLLADLLGQMIPREHFQLQYQFRNGTRVDAVIFAGDHLVPIDAKFPLDNFERFTAAESTDDKKRLRKEFARDVKKHIDDISERYRAPEEGTFDFAMMYIPAENVYYEIIAPADQDSASLLSYALEARVIPVSPNSFFAYLQIILMGLRGLKIDEASREIAESLAKLHSDFKKISDDFGVLGTHLNHVRNTYEKTQRGVDQFAGKLDLVNQVKLTAVEKKEIEESIAS